jgi:hypothetical protein
MKPVIKDNVSTTDLEGQAIKGAIMSLRDDALHGRHNEEISLAEVYRIKSD